MAATITRRARFFLLWMAIASAAALAAWLLERRGETVTGLARAVDGDSIFIASTEIRLYGIDAPELHQTCMRAGQTWACGREATQSLRTMIAGREVQCRSRDTDRFGRMVAVCLAGGLDLGAAMVRGGFAVAYGAYDADEREARDARRGIWSSSFERPAAWRARNPRRDP